MVLSLEDGSEVVRRRLIPSEAGQMYAEATAVFLLPCHVVEWKTLHEIDAGNPVCTTLHIALDLELCFVFILFFTRI